MGGLLGVSDYTLATIFGAVIITVFAWDQFKRPSYEPGAELRRVVEVLSAADLRRGPVYRYAYAFYAAILLIIYATITLSGSLFLVRFLGGEELAGVAPGVEAVDLPPATVAESEPMIGWRADPPPPVERIETAPAETIGWIGDPEVPLVLSLMMVGLAPAVPMLRRIEEKIRFLAHHFSGIPTRLNFAAQELRARRLDLSSHGEGLLIAEDDWRRLTRYAEAARGVRPEQLILDIEKIIAFRAWLLDEGAGLVRRGRTPSIALFEQDVAERIERLLLGLDALSEADDKPETAGRTVSSATSAWRGFAKEADMISNDVCLLLGLYIEHGLAIAAEAESGFSGSRAALDTGTALERRNALDLLARFVDGVEEVIEQDAAASRLAKQTVILVTLLAFVVGAVIGAVNVEGGDSVDDGSGLATGWAQSGLTYAITAILIYAPPIIYVSQRYQALDGRRLLSRASALPNVFQAHWSQWIGRVASIVLVGWILAYLFYGGYGMLAAVIAVGGAKVAENFGPFMLYSLLYDGPLCLQGALLGLALLIGLDEARARGAPRADGSPPFLWTPLVGAAAIAVAAAVLRALSSQSAQPDARFMELVIEPQALLAAGIAALLASVALFSAQGVARRLFHQRSAPPEPLETEPRAAEPRKAQPRTDAGPAADPA